MQVDKGLFYLVAILIGMGMIFVYSLSSFAVRFYDYSDTHFFVRQALIGAVAVFLMWGISRLNPTQMVGSISLFNAIGFSILIVSAFLILIMPFLPASLVPTIGGARRWIRIGGFSLAPVEFFKIGVVFFFAWSLNRKFRYEKPFWVEFGSFFPYIIFFIIITAFVGVLQKDLGQTLVIAITLLVLGLYAGTSKKIFIALFGLLAVGIYALIVSAPHRIRRFESWWMVNQDFILKFLPQSWGESLRVTGLDEPYQISHSFNAISNGNLYGVGLGQGTFKLGFLSEVHTDFILAGIAEEMGFVMIFIIICLVWLVVSKILQISSTALRRDRHLFALGIAVVIASSFLINAYGVISITPVKGIAVPFLSYGGSSILALCVGVGMVLMVSKNAEWNTQ